MTTREQRSRGMAWLGTAASLGVVVGPALGGLLSRRDLHFNWTAGHFRFDSFSIPFFAAALLGLVTFLAALRWLPESMSKPSAAANSSSTTRTRQTTNWPGLVKTLLPLLVLTWAAQFALTVFEATFALFAQDKFAFGPVEVGYVFVVCGLVMTVFQAGAVGFLAGKISEIVQIGVGCALMGAGIVLLATAQTKPLVFAFVALLSLGMAFIAPNISALVSKRAGDRQAGASLGVQNAANSLAQVAGPLLGGALFVWQPNAPYFLSGAVLLVLALFVGAKVLGGNREFFAAAVR